MSEPTDIGQQLLKARELKNLTIIDIEQSTRIPAATINALEINDYSTLPTSYARSFLVQYSEYLEVDASDLIQSLVPNEDITNIGYLKNNQDTVSEKNSSSPKARSNKKRTKGQNRLRSYSKQSDGKKMAQPIAILGLALLIIMAIGYFYKKQQAHPNNPVQSSSKEDALASKQLQSEFTRKASDISTDPQTKKGDDVINIFDPIPAHKSLLSLPPNVVSLRELAGLSDNTNSDQNSENIAVSTYSEDEIAADSNIPQRSGPPPKAMVIDESEE
ncbi:MAG: helix-turn-helix domain-containing protein [Akkermansiaceae bacterium]